MIISNLTIGLGNQLFQYASGLGIARELEQEFAYDDWSPLACGKKHNELIHFCISKQPVTESNLFSISPALRLHPQVLQRLVKHPWIFEKITFGHLYFERSLEHRNFCRHKDGESLYLLGFWQSYKYFDSIRDLLSKELTFVPRFSAKTLWRAQQIQSAPSLFLHVRRGDYLTAAAQSTHGSCELEYYRAAYRKVYEAESNVTTFIFSDDISWCRSVFSFIEKVEFVDHTNMLTAYEDLYLMSLCTHAILANSSFSWWGAWIGEKNKKMILAPSQWYTDPILNKQTTNLCPANWIRL